MKLMSMDQIMLERVQKASLSSYQEGKKNMARELLRVMHQAAKDAPDSEIGTLAFRAAIAYCQRLLNEDSDGNP